MCIQWEFAGFTRAKFVFCPDPCSLQHLHLIHSNMRVGYALLCACVQVCGLPFYAESVIKGWDEGVKTMCSREVALLTCKPEYAYGEKGSPPKIPANATLQFEVELLSWQGEDITTKKDGGVRRIILARGSNTDYYKPKEGAAVKGLFRREGRGESCTYSR